MKRLIEVLAAILFVVVLLSGCVTSPRQAAYKSLASIGFTVDTAMKAAAEAKVAGKISDQDWQTIAAAHDKYRAAFRGAVIMAKMDYTQPAETTVVELSNALLAAIYPFITKPN